MLQEFRDFITKGNVVDIAVAFVIGAAFGSVVSAFTGRIVTPLIAMIFDLPSMADVGTFGEVMEDGTYAGSVGAFLDAFINFLIVGFVMFLVVKAYNRMKAPAPEPEPEADPEDVVLLRQIRDSLAK